MRQKAKCKTNIVIVERMTSIPRDQMYLMNLGNVLNDKNTTEESNIEARATIDMSLRIMGGWKKKS